jgi:hypothetical protein
VKQWLEHCPWLILQYCQLVAYSGEVGRSALYTVKLV